jgi:hypothetical protein
MLVCAIISYYYFGDMIAPKRKELKVFVATMKEVGIVLFHLIGSLVLPIIAAMLLIQLLYSFMASLI